MTTRILFVCLGNICRSPAAEAVLRAKMPRIETDSAGTSNWHVGEPPYGLMQKAAQVRGFDLAPLRARQFTGRDFEAFDLILAMDADNLREIEGSRPAGSDTPVRLLTDYGPQDADHVPDPYYTRDFDGALDLIEHCIDALCRAEL